MPDCLTPRRGKANWVRATMTLVLLSAVLPAQAVAKQPERVLVYEVREGDFLRALARRFYGRTGAWTRIYHDNRRVIGSNPNRIVPGMRLRLADLPARALVSVPPKLPVAKAPGPMSTELPSVSLTPMPDPIPSPLSTLPSADPPSLPVTQTFAPRALEWLDYVPVGSSLVIAGSGQMMQGRWEKGVTHLSLMALSLLAFKTASDQGDRPLQALSGLGVVGITLWSPWEAFLNLSHGSASPSVTDSSRP